MLELHNNPMFRLLVVDSRSYNDMATAIVTGHWAQVGPYWQPPFYPYFLTVLYKLASPDPMIARVAQAILGSISCLLVFRIGRRLFGRRAAWIAWGVASAYGPLVFFDLQILNANLVIFLLLLCVEWVTTARGLGKIVASGLAAGCAAITVATSLVVIPIIAGWIAFSNRLRSAGRPSGRWAWRAAGIFLIAAAVPILTITAVNYVHCGEVVLISYNGGINFWIGNNPDYERTVGIRPGRAWDALDKELRLARVPTAAQSSGYWFDKSLRWIKDHPADYVRLLAHKSRLYLRGDELWRNQQIYPFRQGSWVLRLLMWVRGIAFPFGLLLPVAIAGMITLSMAKRGRPGEIPPGDAQVEWLLLSIVVIYSAGVIAFFPAGRYRIPVVPFLILFASGGISFWIDAARRRGWSGVVVPASVVLAVGLLSNVGVPAMPSSFNSDAYTDLGFSHQERKELDEAVRLYETALRIDPNNMEAANNLGTVRLIQGKPEEAEPYFLRVLAVYPEDRKALVNLGTLYLQRREPYWAGYYFLRAQRSDPTAPNAADGTRFAGQMADQLEDQQLKVDPQAFLSKLEDFIRDEPQNDFLYERLMRLLESRGLDERALAVVRERLRTRPEDSDLRLTAARLLERLGRPEEARRVLQTGR